MVHFLLLFFLYAFSNGSESINVLDVFPQTDDHLEDLTLEITEATWDRTFQDNTKPLLIVEFYSPLCGMILFLVSFILSS
jgi:hypothetical protein